MSRSKQARSPLAGEPWIPHPLSLRESIAWKHLPNNARRVLDRLEREHMRHGARDNGKLPCTYQDFTEAGVPGKGVALAIRQAVALGFLEVTYRAPPSVATFRRSNEYRLTYVFNRGCKPEDVTHEWRLVSSDEQAKRRLSRAGGGKSEVHSRRAKSATRAQVVGVAG